MSVEIWKIFIKVQIKTICNLKTRILASRFQDDLTTQIIKWVGFRWDWGKLKRFDSDIIMTRINQPNDTFDCFFLPYWVKNRMTWMWDENNLSTIFLIDRLFCSSHWVEKSIDPKNDPKINKSSRFPQFLCSDFIPMWLKPNLLLQEVVLISWV